MYYTYGHAYDRFAALSYFRRKLQPLPEPEIQSALNFVIEIAAKIAELMAALIPDQEDWDYVVICLLALEVSIKDDHPQLQYPPEVLEIFSKYNAAWQ